MARGSMLFEPSDVSESNIGYPEPFREGQRKRYNSRLGDHPGSRITASILFEFCPVVSRPLDTLISSKITCLGGIGACDRRGSRDRSAFQPEQATAILPEPYTK